MTAKSGEFVRPAHRASESTIRAGSRSGTWKNCSACANVCGAAIGENADSMTRPAASWICAESAPSRTTAGGMPERNITWFSAMIRM